jgi:hypothetical protein
MIKVPSIIEAPEVPLTSRVKNQRQNVPEKYVNFDTFDGHFMVNYIEPNLQEIIFGPIRVVGTIYKIAIPGAGKHTAFASLILLFSNLV